jgi:hypothetical protein
MTESRLKMQDPRHQTAATTLEATTGSRRGGKVRLTLSVQMLWNAVIYAVNDSTLLYLHCAKRQDCVGFSEHGSALCLDRAIGLRCVASGLGEAKVGAARTC